MMPSPPLRGRAVHDQALISGADCAPQLLARGTAISFPFSKEKGNQIAGPQATEKNENKRMYDRGDNFVFDYEPSGILFG